MSASKLSLSLPTVTWCRRAVNRAHRSRRAASRTPFRPIDAGSRPCVRGAASLEVFPLAGRLPSTSSSGPVGGPSFAGLAGTTRPSDFPREFTSCAPLSSIPNRPYAACAAGRPRDLPGSGEEVPNVRRVSDCAGPAGRSRGTRPSASPSSGWTDSAPRSYPYRSSIPRPLVPLSTLHVRPRDRPRMTRGRGDSLRLPRTALASALLQRLTGAPSLG